MKAYVIIHMIVCVIFILFIFCALFKKKEHFGMEYIIETINVI